jgi:hypothetical protein
MFGSNFPVHTSPLVATPEKSRAFADILRLVDDSSPGLSYAPWIAPVVAVCLDAAISKNHTLAIILAMLRGPQNASLPVSKTDSWVITSVFELLLGQYDRHNILRTAAFTASRYGELVYHTDGKVTASQFRLLHVGSNNFHLCIRDSFNTHAVR